MSIYFIAVDGDPTRVKIGKAHNIARRLTELQRFPSSAWRKAADVKPLKVLVECEGYSECEAALHRMLGAHRLFGEWFDATAPIVQDVLEFAKGRGFSTMASLAPTALAHDRYLACEHHTLRELGGGVCLLCDEPRNNGLLSDVGTVQGSALGVELGSAQRGTPGALPFTAGTPTKSDGGGTPSCVAGASPARPTHDAQAEAILATLGASVTRSIDKDARDAAALEAELDAELKEYETEIALRSFAEFVKQAVAANVVPGLRHIEWAPHLDALCGEAQAMIESWLVAMGRGTEEQIANVDAMWSLHGLSRVAGEMLVQNWIGNVPPSTLKSTLIMVLLNAWVWLLAPDFKFGAASGIDKNVERDSDAARDVVTSAWYRETFAITWTIRHDTDSKGLWVTTAGGSRLSRTVGAGFTGQHVNGCFVDDPDDADKVWNESARKFVQNRWTRAIENRVVDERIDFRMVLQQRVHVDDFTAYVTAIARWSPTNLKGWAQLCIALEFGKQPKDVPERTPFGWSDWRTKPGQCMHPERFPLSVINDKRIKLTEQGFEGQYNQNPLPLDGGLLPRSSLRWFVIEGTAAAINPALLRKRPDGCMPREELPPVILARDKRTGRLDLDWLTVTVDCSNGSTNVTASAVGLLVVGGKDELRFVMDDRTEVMGPLEMDVAIKAAVAAWSPQCGRVLVELKAAGETMIALLNKALASGAIKGSDGKPVQVVVEKINVPSGDNKIVRARAMAPAFQQGHVLVLDGAPWLYERQPTGLSKILNAGFVAEVCGFPFAKRNDRIDALSQLMTYYRENGEAEQRARSLNVW